MLNLKSNFINSRILGIYSLSGSFVVTLPFRYLYGLNFATPADAQTFGSGFEQAVNALKGYFRIYYASAFIVHTYINLGLN
jgi:hypothetical protein